MPIRRFLGYQQRAGPHLDQALEHAVQFTFGNGFEYLEPDPECTGRLLHLMDDEFGARISWIYEKGNYARFGYEFAQEFKPLRLEGDRQTADARDIPAGPVHARDETVLYLVAAGLEDNRYRGGCCLRCKGGRGRAACRDDSDLTANEIGGQQRQSIVLTVRPPIFDRHVPPLDVSGLAQTLAECGRELRACPTRTKIEIPDNWNGCLRARRKRPSGRRAAEQRDEVAAGAHSITSSARASRVGGISRPSALAVVRLITSSNFVGCMTGRSAGFSPLRMRPTYTPT